MKGIQLASLLSLLLSFPCLAAHITDKLVVGLYEKAELDEKPLRLLSSGTPLEVITSSKGYTQIRLADDTKGWVDSSYVTEEKPASMMLLEAQARLRQLKDQPDEVSSDFSSPPSLDDVSLKQELNSARARITELENALRDLHASRKAEKELIELKGRVRNALELLADGQSVEPGPSVAGARDNQVMTQYRPWIIGGLAVVIGFAAGIGFIDYRIRKRYGGFRI